MFSPNVKNLRQFYATPLGESARGLIAAALGRCWPEAKGDALLGVGYATPYLAPYLDAASPVLACMPAGQGAAYWPPERANLTFLAHESELPLPENCMNRVLMVHSVEHSEQLSWMMREAWRVLTPGGRVLAIVPNRLGFWSRSSRSPFGYGRPFSLAQLRDLFTEHEFTVTRTCPALFTPPLRFEFLWKLSPTLETIGTYFCRPLAGVLIVEAEKQIYAAIRQPVIRRLKRAPLAAATKPALGMKYSIL